MIDVPLVANSLDKNDMQAEAQFREAPWDAKRLVLKLQLAKQIFENERKGIDTSVIVYDLTDNKKVTSYNTEYVHWAASLSKLFVTSLLLEDLRAGKTTLDTVVSWDSSDRRAGAGEFDSDGSPTSATLRSVLFDMLNRSGNTAVRIIVNKALGGAAAVNARYEQVPELKVTRLEPVDANRFLLGYTTPKEVDFILNKLYMQQDSYASVVKNAMETNIFNDYGPRSQVKDQDTINVIDKMGQLNDPEGNNRHDVGVIENVKSGHKLRYVLMTTNYEQPAGVITDNATASLQEFGKDMLRFEGDRTPKTAQEQTLQTKSVTPATENGRLVY
jgi:beta-lactamase class A